MIINFSTAIPNKINVEDYSCWKASLFQETYSRAERCLNEIVSADIELQEKARGDKDLFSRLYEENNKAIAFVGDRGSGKTSAMVSFVKACTENKLELTISGKLRYCSFFSLPVIEPSKLSDGESIVGFVVSQIYSDLEKILERDKDKISRNLLENIVADCTDLREALRVQGMTTVELLRQNTDELAHLRLLSQTKRLTEKLGDLIQNYLELRAVERKGTIYPNKFLIIPIDDLDTSIPNVYQQIEELRNYLMLPGVIITLALKIEQLSDALEQQHISALKDLFHNKLLADAQPAEMAAKYIQKVIPDQRRVELPSFDLHILPDCSVITDDSDGKAESLFECFADLIMRKTGIIIIADEQQSHPLIPHNLRALHQAVLMLQKMLDIGDLKGENGKSTALIQLQKFENWILELLNASTLNETLVDIIRRFVSHSDRNLAAFLWRSLEMYLTERRVAGEVSRLLQRDMTNENISIGDVLYLLTMLHKTEVEDDFTLVGAAVRMLYSVRIHRQMIRSLKAEENTTIEESLNSMPENGFERVWTIFNGLVYDTQEKITYDGFENMANADASEGKVIVKPSEDVFRLNGDEIHDLVNPSASYDYMSVEEAVWCSFFVVCFGRVLSDGNIHSLQTSTLNSILEPHTQKVSGAAAVYNEPSFVFSNWMAFVHNLLRPRYTSHRLLWQIKSANASDEYSVAIKKFENMRYPLLFERLHIDSVDYLDAIVRNMVENKVEICQNAKDKLATMSGFFYFAEGMLKALDSVNNRAVKKIQEVATANYNAETDPLLLFLSPSDKDTAYQRFSWLWNN